MAFKRLMGNSSSVYYAYDACQRVVSIKHATGPGAATVGAPIVYFVYQRDPAGRIVRIRETTRNNLAAYYRYNNLAIYYQYDAANRLTSEVWANPSPLSQVYAFTYKYDQASNRHYQNRAYKTTSEQTYYNYNALNQVIKRIVGATYAYYFYNPDGTIYCGQNLSNVPTYYLYDLNRLTRCIWPVGTTPYYFAYDGLLNRVKMVKGGTPAYFMWNGLNQMEERNAAGSLVARYTHGNPIMPGVGSIVEVQRPVGSQTYFQYLHMDHQGSVAVVTDGSQNVIATYTNDAFGRQINSPPQAHPWLEQDFQFQSNWMTFFIGGYQYCLSPSRVYDPVLGRFLQADPMPTLTRIIKSTHGNGLGIYARTIFSKTILLALSRDRTGENLYNYVRNNAPNGTDPTGLFDFVGHFLTTYIVALAAGLSPADALVLAQWSQIPDQVKDLDAMGRYTETDWRHSVRYYLHSLTGGDPGPLRDYIRCLIKSGKLSLQDIGLLIHALGDTYAHSYIGSDNQSHLYGDEVGHVRAGHTPDFIGSNPANYISYAQDLYSTLTNSSEPINRPNAPNPGVLQQIAQAATAAGQQYNKLTSTQKTAQAAFTDWDSVDRAAIDLFVNGKYTYVGPNYPIDNSPVPSDVADTAAKNLIQKMKSGIPGCCPPKGYGSP